MKRISVFVGVFFAAMLAPLLLMYANGQNVPLPQPKPPEIVFITVQKPDQYLATKFKGTDVMGPDNKKIGDVSDLLFDKSGKIEAFIVSVGGFLGMGAKDVGMEPDAFEVVPGDKSKNESDKLRIRKTHAELKEAMNFEPYRQQQVSVVAAAEKKADPSKATPIPGWTWKNTGFLCLTMLVFGAISGFVGGYGRGLLAGLAWSLIGVIAGIAVYFAL